MFLLDDVILAPLRGVHWLVREIYDAASEEQRAEEARLKDELRALYMRLETGQISEEEFDRAEGPLLDRLDRLEAERTGGAAGGHDGGGSVDDEDDGEEQG